MKKSRLVLLTLLAFSLVLCLSGCSSSGGVELLDWEIDEWAGYTYIDGKVKNNTNQTVRVKLVAKYYDSDGVRLKTRIKYVPNLSPGKTAKFEIAGGASFDNVDNVELDARKT